MIRKTRLWCWLVLLGGVAGCGDSIDFVQRDFCNVQHEIIDKMTYIVDDATAKQFNEAYKGRYKEKEEVVDARREKIENNLFTEPDRIAHKERLAQMIAKDLKGQYDSLDSRYRVLQNRLRRIMVKLVEDQAEAAKAQGRSFTVSSADVCPNLTNLEKGAKFGKGGGGIMMLPGAPMGMAGMAPMTQPGGPGGANPGGPGMMMGGQQPAAAAAPPAVDPKANENLVFVLAYTFTGDGANPWQQTVRTWKLGNTPVGPIEVNGINITPLYTTP